MRAFNIHIPGLVRVKTRTYETPLLTPPGIVTGAAYTAGDAIGRQFSIDLPFSSGVLQSANYYDNDDEGIQVDLVIVRGPWVGTTPVADNGSFDLLKSARDVEKIIYEVQFAIFADYTNAQHASVDGIGRAFDLGGGHTLWLQARARGALNIAAGALPTFRLAFLADY